MAKYRLTDALGTPISDHRTLIGAHLAGVRYMVANGCSVRVLRVRRG